MRLAFIILGLSLSACGLDPYSVAHKVLTEDNGNNGYTQPSDSTCNQPFALVSYLENHTNRAVNLTLYFENWHSKPYGQTTNVSVQIPAGGTYNGNLGTVNDTEYYSCSPTPITEMTDLKGDTDTFRKCTLKTGAAYLIDASDQCPAYTSEAYY